jgi:hypothetical protein
VEGVCPYAAGEEVSWTGGELMWPRGTHGHASAPWLRAPADRAMPGSRRRAFDRISSASGAGGVRLHRRVPSAGIPDGAATGSSRAAISGDGMPRPTAVASGDGTPRRTAADAMTQGGRCTRGRPCGAGW